MWTDNSFIYEEKNTVLKTLGAIYKNLGARSVQAPGASRHPERPGTRSVQASGICAPFNKNWLFYAIFSDSF